MKNKKEEKIEKRQKVIKIVGSSIGLTICTGLFVFLLVVGIRGCASSVNKTNDREVNTSQPVKVLDDVPNNAVVVGDEYTYNYPFNGDKNDVLKQEITDLGGVSKASSVNNSNVDIIYKDTSYNVNYIGVSLGGANNLYNIFLKDSDNNNVLTFTSRLNSNNVWSLQSLTSDSFNFDYLVGDNDNELPNFRELKLNIHYVYSGWSEKPYFYTWVEQYFTLSNELTDPFSINFNNVINPFGPLGSTFDYFVTNYQGTYTISKGLFKDYEGTFYKEISIRYITGTGTRYGTTTDYNVYTGNGVQYLSLHYIKMDGTLVAVNNQDFGIATSGSDAGSTVMLKSNHWVSSIYQYLTIYDLIEGSNSSNYSVGQSRLSALSSLNNVSEYTGITGGGGSIGSTGAFTLIGSAFSALIPIFNTQVLPGINLWTLLLIPLLGTIILFIVWLFKR